MLTSIALCTYNGARFLPPQLASLAAQDLPPDELVVCDDGSTDDTCQILERFAGQAAFSVRLERNPANLGSTQNFARAISLCRGKYIFPADQDDVWLPHKLRRLTELLEQDGQAGLAFSDATLVDEALVPLGGTLKTALQFTARERRQIETGRLFDALLRRNLVTGAAMAFRSEYRDLLLPIPPGWVHDYWIALLISAVAGGRYIGEPLIQYRQHARQQIGERRPGLMQQIQKARAMGPARFRELTNAFRAAHQRLTDSPGYRPSPAVLASLAEKVRHWSARTGLHESRAGRWHTIWREWASYRQYSLGWKSVAQDLFL